MYTGCPFLEPRQEYFGTTIHEVGWITTKPILKKFWSLLKKSSIITRIFLLSVFFLFLRKSVILLTASTIVSITFFACFTYHICLLHLSIVTPNIFQSMLHNLPYCRLILPKLTLFLLTLPASTRLFPLDPWLLYFLNRHYILTRTTWLSVNTRTFCLVLFYLLIYTY